jgi:3-hydroxyacyl-[acyl-carrier-protein] dehydratase
MMGKAEPTIAGEFYFDPDDPIYADHFPGRPVVPGSLIVEAFMTAVRPFLKEPWCIILVENFRFRHFISPGRYAFCVTSKTDGSLQCVLYDDGRTVAAGLLSKSDEPC